MAYPTKRAAVARARKLSCRMGEPAVVIWGYCGWDVFTQADVLDLDPSLVLKPLYPHEGQKVMRAGALADKL